MVANWAMKLISMFLSQHCLAKFHLDRERQFLFEFSVEKLVLLSFRGNFGKIESEKTEL